MHAFEAHFHSDRHQFNQKSRRAASHIELKVAEISVGSSYHGGFQLLDLIIMELKIHMTCMRIIVLYSHCLNTVPYFPALLILLFVFSVKIT